jgi:hypothetical protein
VSGSAAGGGGGAGGAAGLAGSAGAGGEGGTGGDAGGGGSAGAAADPIAFAGDLHELFIHDACTGPNPSQPDTCVHAQRVEESVVFGGEAGTVYDVTLRIRGLFEPTNVSGGQTPMPEHPYFKIGGTVTAADYSQWQIRVSEPERTYFLNHYPSTSHTIYQQDFEATLEIAAGAEVTVLVIDGNDRQIDNGREGLPDRRQQIEGVTTEVLDGQVIRLDVIAVEAP